MLKQTKQLTFKIKRRSQSTLSLWQGGFSRPKQLCGRLFFLEVGNLIVLGQKDDAIILGFQE